MWPMKKEFQVFMVFSKVTSLQSFVLADALGHFDSTITESENKKQSLKYGKNLQIG